MQVVTFCLFGTYFNCKLPPPQMHPIYNVSIETKILQFFHGLLDGNFPLVVKKVAPCCIVLFLPFPFKFEYVMRSIERTWILGVNILLGYYTSDLVRLQSYTQMNHKKYKCRKKLLKNIKSRNRATHKIHTLQPVI